MSFRAAANTNRAEEKPADNVIRLSLFDRPLADGHVQEKFTLYNYLTFRNLVISAGVLALLVFVGNVASARIAVLAAVLLGFFALILMEVSSRRKWERDMLGQLQRMSIDYDRLVRDVARNRNDTAALRKRLSDAAAVVARGYDRAPGEPVEQRMIKILAEQLSDLSDLPREEPVEEMAAEVAAPEEISIEELSLDDVDSDALGDHLSDGQVLQFIKAAVKQDRVDLFLQPIVGLPQRKVRFFEMFSRIRIRQESYLPAGGGYVDIASKQDLMPVIDNLLLLRGLQIIRTTEEGNYNRAFFFNITSLTLNDPKFMGDLVEFIAQNRTLAPRLIFELAQQDLALMNADILPVLDGLSKLGCRFSMDRVRSLKFDFDYLEERHIRFVKVDASLLMDELKEEAGLQRLKRLKAEFDRQGIDLVVEKIETDRQLLELLEVDIDYGQGYLFGKPLLYAKD